MIESFSNGSALKLSSVKVRQVKAGFKSRCHNLSRGQQTLRAQGKPRNPQPAAQRQNRTCSMNTQTLPQLKGPHGPFNYTPAALSPALAHHRKPKHRGLSNLSQAAGGAPSAGCQSPAPTSTAQSTCLFSNFIYPLKKTDHPKQTASCALSLWPRPAAISKWIENFPCLSLSLSLSM